MSKNKHAAIDATIIVIALAYIIGGLFAMIPIGGYVEYLYGGPWGVVAIAIYLVVWVWVGAFILLRR